ncbi:DUF397 domain-containing protein [Nocardiopsis tropica]|uniref:DUF397 domain-containing protein n=1 Tax=Nocardiopsis tropica TaxID=109330 RepID=A0ABU7KR79_9ACTN|nr:DUF397 domain-containing protein [Nocardiopsis umidischolae]MEE2051804.1 DUF397 domain-containing protein [Nocardiopsis umidischolae]
MTQNIPDEAFQKSSYSSQQGECVEVARLDGRAHLRDTKHRDLGYLSVSAGEWALMLQAAVTETA